MNEIAWVLEDELVYLTKSIRYVTSMEGQFEKAHGTDAGYDILSSENTEVQAGKKTLIHTDLKVAIPEGHVGIIKSRSGLSVKHDLEVGAGVIDCGYTGEIVVVLRNCGGWTYPIERGDKIAQMVVLPIFQLNTEKVDSLDKTLRADKGFNSTGYK